MIIESKKVNVKNSQAEVFAYLGDLNNFKELLPQDKISEWQSATDFCSFKVQGMATIDMHLKSSESNVHHIVSGERAPFSFKLDIYVNEDGSNCIAYNVFNGEINPFLKMMVEKPLTNLFNYIADRLAVVKSQN